MLRSPARVLTLVLLLAAFVAAGSQSTAVASNSTTTVTLPLNGFYQMLVDPSSHHVFIDGADSQANNSIVVLGADGSVAGSIPGESGAAGMVLDGSTLYVARCGWGQIDEIDTATLTKIGSITAAVGGDCRLGLAGGRLWYPATDQWTPIDSVTIADPHTVATDQIPAMITDPVFLTAPNDPDELWIAETGISTSTVRLVDTSQPTPTIVSSTMLSSAGFLNDWTISSDGQTLYDASGSPYELLAFHTSDMSSAGVYPTGPYPRAVDLSPSGNQVVGGIDQDDANVQEFNLGNGVPVLTLNTTDAATQFTPAGGVRFSEDGTRIFSITTDTSNTVELHVTSLVPPSTLTLGDGGAKTAPLGAVLHLSGTLQLPGGADPTGQTIDVSATLPGGGTEVIGQATANAAGSWSISTPALKPAGSWVFHAAFAGGTYPSSSASVGIRIGNPAPSLTVTSSASAITYGGHVVVTAHLSKWHSSRIVTIYRSQDGSTPAAVASGPVSAAGTFSFTAHPTKRTVFTARWAGDDTYLPAASAGRIITVHAVLGITQAGYYTSSGGVRLYHYRSGCWTNNAQCPHFTGHLAPALSGRGVRFTLQKLVSGRWVTALAGTVYTGNSGLCGVIYRYTGTAMIGHLMRVHATWAGNSDYLAATSPWVEFELTH